MSVITDKTFGDMLAALQKILRVNTVKSAAEPGKPFGAGNAACLDAFLAMAEDMGFETYNCDGYAGHVDFGDGETFGVLGHLDVVPVADKGWTCDPFGGEIKDGFLYGRGVLDDKGPVVSCLFAMKQLKDEGFRPSKKIRLIVGCDEESGWGCMDYYARKVPLPKTGFSPDGDFPVINVEKGVCHIDIDAGALPSGVKEISGGQRVNIVMDECRAVIEGGVSVYKQSGAAAPEKTFSGKKSDLRLEADGKNVIVTAFGKAAHGSTPEFGDNAAKKLFAALSALFPGDKTISLANAVCADYYGETLGIAMSDGVSGKMTVNVGRLRAENGRLVMGLDIRYPVSCTESDLLKKLSAATGAAYKITGSHKPLYVPEDNPLVKTLLDVYKSVTGEAAAPLAVGGATYARALPCGVAFGPVFPGDEKVIHETNERVSLDKLRLMTELYYTAIKRLCM